MSNRRVQTAGMKLNHSSTGNGPGRIIQQFGDALLVEHASGRHELVGGNAGDLTAAHEWVSLFAHEIVFSRATRQAVGPCRLRAKTLPARF